ncbi:cysteine peptidase family C39 domain-containing protein [Lacrimispora sp. BS-2]|uniref:Cysteine peptidase family C39 domain-containing protein n=1 Tax=Lacrimispora sp. BS-2 TaxID=3151850 RepID=A0AAU7PL69_9FIRM
MKKYILVKQEEEMDCGVASLSAIFQFYGNIYNLNGLKKLMDYNNQSGTSFLQMYETANFLNYDVEAYCVDNINEINKTMLPCIVQLEISENIFHFVVIYKIRKKYIVAADPAKGMVKINKAVFMNIFTGNLLIIKKFINQCNKL